MVAKIRSVKFSFLLSIFLLISRLIYNIDTAQLKNLVCRRLEKIVEVWEIAFDQNAFRTFLNSIPHNP